MIALPNSPRARIAARVVRIASLRLFMSTSVESVVRSPSLRGFPGQKRRLPDAAGKFSPHYHRECSSGSLIGNEMGPPRVAGGMKIAVIGTGNIGRSIGSKWHQAGYDVVFGSRRAGAEAASASGAEAASASGEGPDGAPVVGIGDALAGADVVLLAVPGQAAAEVIAAQSAALAGKTVIDAGDRIGQREVN